MTDKERIERLERALAHFTRNRYVVQLPGSSVRFLDTDIADDDDIVLFDRWVYERRSFAGDPADEIIAAMAANLDYVRYVAACDAENLEPHSLHMWDVHGRPKGPLGETLLQERSYEVEQGGF